MKQAISGLLTGLLFGLGLAISGMTDPARVLGFLDIFGAWDATLAFVMAAAVVTTTVGYRLVLKGHKPLFAGDFSLPTRTDIDRPLALGAVLFGAGWGLVGYCPGPAVASLSAGQPGTLVFVATMLIGLVAGTFIRDTMNRRWENAQ